MQRLIIITGDLAAGKSTLAASISEELNIPFITKDSLKEIACDIFGYHTRQENRLLSVSAVNSMIYFFSQIAKVGQDLIIEANFRSEELIQFKAIAEQHYYRVVLIELTGDVNLLYQRFMDRLNTRHIAHHTLDSDMTLENFANYIDKIRNENLIFAPHEIDMSDLDEEEVVYKALDIVYREFGK
ncbi:MAG TPA: ATP-binding protein [Erysipelotrichaceae bacterium]|nr:ATP-binding protein [Erysipelotrichaceae bacterium]